MPPRLKVCGIRTREAALHASKCGCSYIGINMIPTSKRSVSVEFAAELMQIVDTQSIPVLVCNNQPLSEVQHLLKRTQATHVQLHGSEDVSYIHALQQAGYTVIKAISCIPSNTTISMVRQRIEMYRSCIILLDVEKDHPHEKFSKSFLNVICRTKEIMVAGGITTDDLPSLLAEPCPWGFDVARGIETDGVVDMQKISTLCALLHSYS